MECACKRSPARTFTLALIVMITANGGAGGGSGGVRRVVGVAGGGGHCNGLITPQSAAVRNAGPFNDLPPSFDTFLLFSLPFCSPLWQRGSAGVKENRGIIGFIHLPLARSHLCAAPHFYHLSELLLFVLNTPRTLAQSSSSPLQKLHSRFFFLCYFSFFASTIFMATLRRTVL